MSLHKQSDVKNHLSPRYRAKVHLCEPVSDATGFSGAEPDAIKAIPLGFAEDFLAEHTSPGQVPASAGPITGSLSTQAAAGSRNAQA